MPSKERFAKDFLEQGAVISTAHHKKILVAWGNLTKHPSPIKLKLPIFYFSNYFLNNETPWIAFENNLELSIPEFIDLLLPYATQKLSRWWHSPHKDLFKYTLDDIRKKILLNELQKAVPFIYEISPTPMTLDQKAASLIQASRYLAKYPFNLYGFWQSHQGMLGLTPELLFSLFPNDHKWRLHTFALAGTKDAAFKKHPLHTDLKTQLEHEIVQQGITSSLDNLGKLSMGELEIVALPSLCHLKTRIALDLDTSPSLAHIIGKLHPTPALGAYPRIPGIQWLKYYQTLIDRKQYGAPVGYTLGENQESHFYVAIRNVQWSLQEMRIAAGCGIVLGSRFEEEWYEVNLKIKSIKETLAL